MYTRCTCRIIKKVFSSVFSHYRFFFFFFFFMTFKEFDNIFSENTERLEQCNLLQVSKRIERTFGLLFWELLCSARGREEKNQLNLNYTVPSFISQCKKLRIYSVCIAFQFLTFSGLVDFNGYLLHSEKYYVVIKTILH